MQVITHSKHNVNLSKTERIASVLGGGALALLGIRKGSPSGFGLALLGGEAIRRGATGHCYMYEALGVRTADKGQGAATTSVPYELGIRVDRAITVNKPREEVFRFWRQLDNLPRFMKHIQSVKMTGDSRSHWVAEGPGGKPVEWDAEIINEIPNELIGWRSLEGSQVDNAGSVQFCDAPDGRGTEVKVELQYNPPAGIVGAVVAKLFGQEPTQQIQEDLRRFKQLMEAGEIPTTQGQPSGRDLKHGSDPLKEHHRKSEEALTASEHSFPASDAPAYSH